MNEQPTKLKIKKNDGADGDSSGESEEFCEICKKTRSELLKENKTLMEDEGSIYCDDCYQTVLKKRLLTQSPMKKRPEVETLEDAKAKASSTSILRKEEPESQEFFSKQFYEHKPSTDPFDSLTVKDKETADALSNILSEFRQNQKKIDNVLTSHLEKYWKENNIQILKRGMLKFPPICEFIQMVIEFMIEQIDIDHPVLKKYGIDAKTEDGRRKINRRRMKVALKRFKFNFSIRYNFVVKQLLNSAILSLETLYAQILERKLMTDRLEYYITTLRGFLMSFHYRNNIFVGSFYTVSDDPVEIQKIFSGAEINLMSIAAVENRLTSDITTKHASLFTQLGSQKQKEFIIENFDTKFVELMVPESKMDIYEKLIRDEEVIVSPTDLIALFAKMNRDNRKKMLEMLRPILNYDEFDVIIPELKKIRGDPLLGAALSKKD